MNRRLFILIAVVGFIVAPTLSSGATRPNVVLILCDDLGYGDLPSYGHPHIQTPHLDRLITQGAKLTECYAAAPMCSPSRAGLLTGRSPNRTGVYDWIAHDNTSEVHLRRSEVTFASLMRDAGYATALHGKWHLNSRFNDPAQPQPNDHGFDYWFATQFNSPHLNPTGFVRNGKALGPQKGYACQIVVDDAIRWLKEERDANKPFLQFVSFHESHHPVMSPPDLVDRYYPRVTEKRDEAIYFANVENIDRAVGHYLAALDTMGLADNTLVVFTSDHGPQTRRHNSVFARSYGRSGPLRGRKRYLWEGGIRVPGIIRWPGVVKPGGIINTPIGFVDLMPTLATIAGYDTPNNRVIDGSDITPVLTGKPFTRTAPLHWHFYSPILGPQAVLREGDWVLTAQWDVGVKPFAKGTRHIPEFEHLIKRAELTSFQLYNIADDIHQNHDLAEQHLDRVAAMSRTLIRLHRSVRDEAPVWKKAKGQP